MKVANTKGITISWASLIDIDTGKEIPLTEKLQGRGKPSRCHFMELIKYKGYTIQLRLDWNDFKSRHPVLDAQIWKIKNGKKEFLDKKAKWHQTKPKWNDQIGKMVYEFEFEGFKPRFALKMRIEKDILTDYNIIRKKQGWRNNKHGSPP